ncbi:MAG: aconitate hydratase, partial [Amphiplicatus sp.]
MMRGTFANIRIKNQMLPGTEGGVTKYVPTGAQMSIYDAAMKYIAEGSSLVVVAGKEYGTGSSRDWAAKGTILLGIRAVIAESFERIHRSNLVGMGVLPLQFADGDSWKSLGLTGDEMVTVHGVVKLEPRQTAKVTITAADGTSRDIEVRVRIDTADELEYYKHGGILQYVMRSLAA